MFSIHYGPVAPAATYILCLFGCVSGFVFKSKERVFECKTEFGEQDTCLSFSLFLSFSHRGSPDREGGVSTSSPAFVWILQIIFSSMVKFQIWSVNCGERFINSFLDIILFYIHGINFPLCKKYFTLST